MPDMPDKREFNAHVGVALGHLPGTISNWSRIGDHPLVN